MKQLLENDNYTSPLIQNETISLRLYEKQICEVVREAGIFTLSADGTTVLDGNEIFAIVVRYVSKNDMQVKEHVLQTVEAVDHPAKGLM